MLLEMLDVSLESEMVGSAQRIMPGSSRRKGKITENHLNIIDTTYAAKLPQTIHGPREAVNEWTMLSMNRRIKLEICVQLYRRLRRRSDMSPTSNNTTRVSPNSSLRFLIRPCH